MTLPLTLETSGDSKTPAAAKSAIEGAAPSGPKASMILCTVKCRTPGFSLSTLRKRQESLARSWLPAEARSTSWLAPRKDHPRRFTPIKAPKPIEQVDVVGIFDTFYREEGNAFRTRVNPPPRVERGANYA